MYLEEVLPEFRKGAKIRSVLWRRGQYLRYDAKTKDIIDENASIYNKYKELCEQHKKEIEDLFNNKEVIVKSISDKKWYERFLRRK